MQIYLSTLRPVSTQENKHGIRSDWTLSILYYSHCRTKKFENTLTLYHRIIGLNWKRKFVPKPRVIFCSDPVRSHAYFPEWKLAFTNYLSIYFWFFGQFVTFLWPFIGFLHTLQQGFALSFL